VQQADAPVAERVRPERRHAGDANAKHKTAGDETTARLD
jgi:hypothetical protein